MSAAPPYQSRPQESDSIEAIDDKSTSQPAGSDPTRGTTGLVTVEGYVSESQKQAQAGEYKFRWASLWQPAVVNPINGKSLTFPLLRMWDPYSTAFWLATLGEMSSGVVSRHFCSLLTTPPSMLRRILHCFLRLVRRCRSDDRSN